MKRSACLLLIFAMAFSAHAQMFYFTFEGLQRSYKVHLPLDYDPDSLYPLVFNLHGLGSNAIEQQLYSGFDFVADTAGLITVYPNGVDNTWNINQPSGINDVGFISALIDTMDANYSIDLSRVFSTGMSMGGFMSYRLACELDTRIAAIASVTGLLVTSPCQPSRPVAILQMHGTADQVVPYAYVPSTISFWTSFDNCPSQPVTTYLPDTDTTDNSTVTVTYYGFCDDSTEVILYTINGGEHTWPGATVNIGITNQDINGSVEIWHFFSKYTLDGIVGIQEKTHGGQSIAVYPNPFASSATLETRGFSDKTLNLILYDLHGRQVRTDVFDSGGRYLVQRCDLPPGMYLFTVNAGKERASCRVVIR